MYRLPDVNTVKYGNSVTFASCITVQLVTLLTTPHLKLSTHHQVHLWWESNKLLIEAKRMGTLTLKSGLMFLFVLAISSPHGSTNPFYAIGKLKDHRINQN